MFRHHHRFIECNMFRHHHRFIECNMFRHHHRFIECNMFSLWYFRKHLALNNNHSHNTAYLTWNSDYSLIRQEYRLQMLLTWHKQRLLTHPTRINIKN
jgi:hypothetical protein